MDFRDPEEFRALYRDMQPRLLRYLRALTGPDAEDLASETWLQVTRDIGTFTGDHDGFRGWVTTIARHRALDHARRRGRRPAFVPVPAEDLAGLPAVDDTEASGIEAVSTDAALRLIATLPADQAEAVLLRAVVGLDASTAGKVTGKRAGAVRSAAHRGLRTLAERLSAARAVGGKPAQQAGGKPAQQAGGKPAQQAGGKPAQQAGSKGVTQPGNVALKDMR